MPQCMQSPVQCTGLVETWVFMAFPLTHFLVLCLALRHLEGWWGLWPDPCLAQEMDDQQCSLGPASFQIQNCYQRRARDSPEPLLPRMWSRDQQCHPPPQELLQVQSQPLLLPSGIRWSRSTALTGSC